MRKKLIGIPLLLTLTIAAETEFDDGPVVGGAYAVAYFHTHAPVPDTYYGGTQSCYLNVTTVYDRDVEFRYVGPTGAEIKKANEKGIPCILYDCQHNHTYKGYTEDKFIHNCNGEGIIMEGHAVNADAYYVAYGPEKR